MIAAIDMMNLARDAGAEIAPQIKARTADFEGRRLIYRCSTPTVRGRSGIMDVFDIWPENFSAAQRVAYLSGLKAGDAAMLGELARAHPDDGALAGLLLRLEDKGPG